MKTKKWILTMAAITIVAVGLATETPKMRVTEVEPEVAMVSFNAAEPTNFELTITNYQNDVVYYYKSKTKQPAYRGKFDFSTLGKGDYHLCLNYGNQSLNSELCVTKDGITTSESIHLYKPFVSFKNDQLRISHLNVSEKPVYVNIYKGMQHVSGVKLGKDFSIQKCLNLAQLEKGDYHVVVTDSYEKHTFEVCK